MRLREIAFSFSSKITAKLLHVARFDAETLLQLGEIRKSYAEAHSKDWI